MPTDWVLRFQPFDNAVDYFRMKLNQIPSNWSPRSVRPSRTMQLSTSSLMDLQAQDKIITLTQARYGQASHEQSLYVECMEHQRQVVHAISGSGNRYAIPFADVLDVEKCTNPITYVVNEKIWTVHQCDPAYLGKPVRAVMAMLNRQGRFTGLHLPKWPGQRASIVLTLEVSAERLHASEQDILRALPTTNRHRFHDPERDRHQVARTAEKRITKFVKGVLLGTPHNLPPLDPSLKSAKGRLQPA